MYEELFESIKIGNLEIKNRLVMPAMNSNLAGPDHIFTQQAVNYYQERAKGGFGLQITEFLCVSEEGLANPIQAGIYDDAFIPMLKKLTDAVHAEGGKIFAQLQHSGRMASPEATDLQPVGASRISFINDGRQIHELRTDEIPGIRKKFMEAALRAKTAGFDGVEIHGAHGYLLNQFMNKAVNKRTDLYGGNPANRVRIVCEIIKEIKEACGADFPVSVRFNGAESMPGGNTINESAAQAILLEEAGADVLNVSYGTPIETYYKDSAFNLQNVKRVKDLVHVPVIGVGRMNDPLLALEAVRGGFMDLAATGRASIADPHYPEKLKAGCTNEIIRCTGCLQRCLFTDSFEEGFGISCMNNPLSGKEGTWVITPTENTKKIAVAGAGPAGLQAAWILAKRGHEVTVFDKDDSIGGSYRLACIPPMKQDLANTVTTYHELGKKYGVEYQLSTEVSAEYLKERNFDEIIDATGSVPVIPAIDGIHGDTVCTAQQILRSEKQFAGKKILVLGAGLVGAETAEFLTIYQNKVTLVDMIETIAPLAPYPVRAALEKRLQDAGVDFVFRSRVIKINDDGIDYQKDEDKGTLSGYDAIVLAFGAKANVGLSESLKDSNVPVHQIGDSLRAGDAKKAIFEATKLALQL